MELLPANDARRAFYVLHWIPWPQKHTNRHQNQTNRTCIREVVIILSFHGGHLEFRIFGMKASSGVVVPTIFGFSAPPNPPIPNFMLSSQSAQDGLFLLHICPTILCRWSLELIFKAKVKLETGNQKIQYGCQAAILKVTSLKINRLLPMTTINMHMKFEIEIPKQT